MRPISSLAIAGLLVAIAGCSAPLQAPGAAPHAPATEKPITLRTQGLLSAKLVTASLTETPGGQLTLSARMSVTNAKGEAIAGLTCEYLSFDLRRKTELGESWVNDVTLELNEPSKGSYELIATAPNSGGSKPAAYVIELTIKNKPLIKDVEY